MLRAWLSIINAVEEGKRLSSGFLLKQACDEKFFPTDESNRREEQEMPLRIKLPAGERIVVNGAVIESVNESSALVFHNKVDILRRKEIMTEEEANTPSRRMYYNVQGAYMFKEDRQKFMRVYELLRDQYLQAAPSAKEICDSIDQAIAEENYYLAIRELQKLMEHEAERMDLQ